MILHLIDVGVPHFSKEPECGRRVRVVHRELDPGLKRRKEKVIQMQLKNVVGYCRIYKLVQISEKLWNKPDCFTF